MSRKAAGSRSYAAAGPSPWPSDSKDSTSMRRGLQGWIGNFIAATSLGGRPGGGPTLATTSHLRETTRVATCLPLDRNRRDVCAPGQGSPWAGPASLVTPSTSWLRVRRRSVFRAATPPVPVRSVPPLPTIDATFGLGRITAHGRVRISSAHPSRQSPRRVSLAKTPSAPRNDKTEAARRRARALIVSGAGPELRPSRTRGG